MGAYYTATPVANFLATWAIRTATDTVLEPCCGDGVFLRAATRRTAALGGDDGGANLSAVDIEINHEPYGIAPAATILFEDFFRVTPSLLGEHDAVIGNPPFVRYHRFNGETRATALEIARGLGVHLSGLTSAWVPFLLHATRFLRHGGRLAVVAPYELTYAIYARPFVAYIAAHFANVTVLDFEEALFPELNEKTVLLLCDGYGSKTDTIHFAHSASLAELTAVSSERLVADSSVSARDLAAGTARVRLLQAPTEVQQLYAQVAQDPRVLRLGDVASLTIGYVTGDNRFFHMSRARAAALDLPHEAMRLAVRKGSDFADVGLGLTSADAERLADVGDNLLFYPESDALHPAVTAYIASGEAELGASDSYKARVRPTWWRVPGVQEPDMFLTVFGHTGPRLVVNDARVVATNSVLVLRLNERAPHARVLAASACSSLAALSAEVEGHHLGGGALKFEPCEARRWLLPAGEPTPDHVLADIDAALRGGNMGKATDLADRIFLVHGLGLGGEQVSALRRTLHDLRQRRTKRRQSHAARASKPCTN